MDNVWLVNGKLVLPDHVFNGVIQVVDGTIRAIRRRAPSTGTYIDARGAYVAPGFLDLHIWGDPSTIAREAVRAGTTAFLTTLGPAPQRTLLGQVAERASATRAPGAYCLGIHLEGPFVNPRRGGALPRRGMRAPTIQALRELQQAATGRIKLMTLAPELPGALATIRWSAAQRIVVSLGHSDADAASISCAVDAGVRAVTHVFNGMPPFHHRRPSLLDAALTDDRLTTMVILDGVHVSPSAFRLLVRAKSAERIALVTDSIEHQGWDVIKRHGAYYRRDGTLAGSSLTMMQAVRNAVRLGGVSLSDAVRMASEVPARLLGLQRSRGALEVGKRADLVTFNEQFQVLMTIVNGKIVYQRGP